MADDNLLYSEEEQRGLGYDPDSYLEADISYQQNNPTSTEYSGPLAATMANLYNDSADTYGSLADKSLRAYKGYDPTAPLESAENTTLLFSSLIPLLAGVATGDVSEGVQAGAKSGQDYLAMLIGDRKQKRLEAKEDYKLNQKYKVENSNKANEILMKSLQKDQDRKNSLEDFKTKRDYMRQGGEGTPGGLPPKESTMLQKGLIERVDKVEGSLSANRLAMKYLLDAKEKGIIKDGDDISETYDNLLGWVKSTYLPTADMGALRRSLVDVLLKGTKADVTGASSNLETVLTQDRLGFKPGTSYKVLFEALSDYEEKTIKSLASQDFNIRYFNQVGTPYKNPIPWRQNTAIFDRKEDKEPLYLSDIKNTPEAKQFLSMVPKGQVGIKWITGEGGKPEKIEIDYTDVDNPIIYYLKEF